MLTEKPWIVEHRHALLVGSILLTVPPLIFIFLIVPHALSPLHSPALFLITFLGFFTLIMVEHYVFTLYTSATRFAEILNAIQHEIVSAKISGLEYSPVLTCKTLEHGEFSLKYFPGSRYSPAWYRLWITTNKPLPARETIFKKKGLLKKSPQLSERLKDRLLAEKLMALKSLKYIMTESKRDKNRLVAMFDDRIRYSETHDIIECLKLLREIEEKL